MIKRSAPYGGIMHEVVEHHGVLHFAGVVAEDASLDMEGQARQVFQQIDELLTANGSSRERVLTALIFVTDMKAKPAMNKAWKEWLGPEHMPTRATIGVADLDGYLIEVVVTAASGT
ncbi:MAG: RidA family protein [Alphaproteobacteria bacterium]